MKSIVLTIEPERDLVLPLSHQHALQGLVYDLIRYDPVLSSELHNDKSGKTDALKLFCFSDLYGTYRYSDRMRTYPGPFRFEIRSVRDVIIDTIAERIRHDPIITVSGCACRIVNVSSDARSFPETGLHIRMNTPVSVYYTDRDGKRRYFSPEEEEFYRLVSKNLEKKYLLIYGQEYDGALRIACLSPGSCRHVVARYKGKIINAYYGEFYLEASARMLAVAYYCGLGSKNASGFGFVEQKGGNRARAVLPSSPDAQD